jgi:hypothetical protein
MLAYCQARQRMPNCEFFYMNLVVLLSNHISNQFKYIPKKYNPVYSVFKLRYIVYYIQVMHNYRTTK